MTWEIREGDCVERMRDLADASVDAIVCDPPYGLSKEPDAAEVLKHWLAGDDYQHRGGGFMGRSWDSFVPGPAVWREAYRVLKPGGHLVAFFGSRTVDLGGMAIRLAGFEIRDQLQWLYGSGFPKSLDVSKAIDKRGGNAHRAQEIAAAIKAAREARGWTTGQADRHFCGGSTNWTWFEGRKGICRPPTPADFDRIVTEWPELAPLAALVVEAERETIGQGRSGIGTAFGDGQWSGEGAEDFDLTAPATPDAERWQGWGTALKPAHEPIVLARKPLAGTVAGNVLAHRTGAINVDGCRLTARGHEQQQGAEARDGSTVFGAEQREGGKLYAADLGRWPANVLLDTEAARMLDAQTGTLTSGSHSIAHARNVPKMGHGGAYGDHSPETMFVRDREGDTGGASRFLYVAKASSAERNAGLDDFETKRVHRYSAKGQGPLPQQTPTEGTLERNVHPTVKPIDVMRWLVRLVTPPGGTVLDPFTGSGTTGCAAALEGFDFVGFERQGPEWVLVHPEDDDFVELATARVAFWSRWPVGTKTDAILAEIGALRVEGEKAASVSAAHADRGQVSMFDLLDAA